MIALSLLWSMIVLVYEFGNDGLGRRWFIGDGLIYDLRWNEKGGSWLFRLQKAVTIGIATARLLVCVTIGRRASNRVLLRWSRGAGFGKTCSMRLFWRSWNWGRDREIGCASARWLVWRTIVRFCALVRVLVRVHVWVFKIIIIY